VAARAAAAAPASAPVAPARPSAARPPVAADADGPPPWAEEEVPDDFSALDEADATTAPAPVPVPADGRTAPPPALHTPAPQTAALQTTTLQPTALQTTALGDRWAALVRPLAAAGSLVAMVRELAWQAELLAVQPTADGGQRFQLRAERESLRNPSLAAKLAAALADALGMPAEVEVQPGAAQDSIARRDAVAREAAQRAAEQLIHDDPDVRALMAQFRTARIVPGSIKPLAADGGDAKAPPP